MQLQGHPVYLVLTHRFYLSFLSLHSESDSTVVYLVILSTFMNCLVILLDSYLYHGISAQEDRCRQIIPVYLQCLTVRRWRQWSSLAKIKHEDKSCRISGLLRNGVMMQTF